MIVNQPSSSLTRRAAILPAVLAWAAVLLQLILSIETAIANGRTVGHGLVMFFGYFTILTNIFVGAVSVAVASGTRVPLTARLTRPTVMATAATSIALVGMAYHALLRQVWDPQGWQLVADIALHYVVPTAFVAFWFFAAPKRDLTFAGIWRWTWYPVAYVVYMLVRGQLTGHYPYPFLDVSALGFERAIANALGLLVAYLVVAVVLLGVGKLIERLL